jgi:hypothetical protein
MKQEYIGAVSSICATAGYTRGLGSSGRAFGFYSGDVRLEFGPDTDGDSFVVFNQLDFLRTLISVRNLLKNFRLSLTVEGCGSFVA